MSELPDEVRAAWDDFWCRLVTRPDGTLDEDAVKSELHDYKVLLDNVPKVYEHITGGRMSKPHYEAADVIAEAEEHYERERRELFAEELRDEAVIERAEAAYLTHEIVVNGDALRAALSAVVEGSE